MVVCACSASNWESWVEGLFEPRCSRLPWALIVPLHPPQHVWQTNTLSQNKLTKLNTLTGEKIYIKFLQSKPMCQTISRKFQCFFEPEVGKFWKMTNLTNSSINTRPLQNVEGNNRCQRKAKIYGNKYFIHCLHLEKITLSPRRKHDIEGGDKLNVTCKCEVFTIGM